jgi:hypothetical protein
MKTFRPIALAVASLAVLLTPACATGAAPVTNAVAIVDAGEIFSAADWTPDMEAALRAAGWGDRLEQVKAHMNESGGGWPKNLADGETRHFHGEAAMKLYKAEEIARFRFYDQDALMLRVPAANNTHMTEGWKPMEDFFIVMTARAVAKAS